MADDNSSSSTTKEYTLNVKNYQDPETYPDNYNWMSSAWYYGILSYLNEWQEQADHYYTRHIQEKDNHDDYLKLYDHVEDQLTGSKNMLSVLGIKAEQWGNNGTWILANKKDCLKYNQSLDNEDDTMPQSENQTWPRPEGDRWTKSNQKTRNLSPKDYSYNEASSATNQLVWDERTKSWTDGQRHYHSDGSIGYISQVVKNDTDTTLPSYSTIGV